MRFTGNRGWDGGDSFALAFVVPCEQAPTVLAKGRFVVDPESKEARRKHVQGPVFENVADAFGIVIGGNGRVERVDESSGGPRRRGALYFPREKGDCRVLVAADKSDV